MRILILIILSAGSLFAQYDSTMYDLIKTTYIRNFDKEIISRYLSADSDKRVKAALLSIAQSSDTSLVPLLLRSDTDEYPGEIIFALAQTGRSEASINFLWNYLYSSPPAELYPEIFYAIGRIGINEDLERIISFYNSFGKGNFPYRGIPEAFLQFRIRGISSKESVSILENEILSGEKDLRRAADALFVLARYESSEKIKEYLKKVIGSDHKIISRHSEHSAATDMSELILKQYALMNFQKLKSFPSDPDFISGIISTDDALLRIELAKSIVYCQPVQEERTINDFVYQLLEEKDFNSALQTVASLRQIDQELSESEKTTLKNKLTDLFYDPGANSGLKGEILLTGYELSGDYSYFEKIMNAAVMPDKYRVRFVSKNPNVNTASEMLRRFYEYGDLSVKIEALTGLLGNPDIPDLNDKLKYTLFDAIGSDYAPLISIASDGIDSLFILKNISELKEIISLQISRHRGDPEYIESVISLINLSERIGSDFCDQIIEKADSSDLYSLKKFIASRKGISVNATKEPDNFEAIWRNAFKYNSATLITTKGRIRIEFKSEIAPLSVANFCKLALEKFYNGIYFHRVVPGFVIQAGDPGSTGWGGPGYEIVSEIADAPFGIGVVGMASAGKDTEGSQFFIMQGSYPHLNGRYTSFGQVTDGMDVVYNITEEDRIINIELK